MKETGYTQVDNKLYDAQPFLTPIAFSVLMRIVRMIVGYGNEESAMSNTFLQQNCNMSKNTVSKAVAELVEFGFLNQDAQQRKTAIYTLNYENIASFDAKKHGQNLASQNLASQDMTIRFPRYDHQLGQNMGSNKENIKKTSLKKTIKEVKPKNNPAKKEVEKTPPTDNKKKVDPVIETANSLVDFWNDNRPVKSAVKVPIWSKVIKTRLKTFTADEIKQAMLHVINDSWYQSKNQVLIKNIIDSDKRCAEVLEKSNQPAKQQSANNQNQGNINANHKPANNQHQQQPKQSQADIYANNIDAQLAAEAEREARQGEYS